MLIAESVIKKYNERKDSENWQQWVSENKEAHEMLEHARKKAEEQGLLDD